MQDWEALKFLLTNLGLLNLALVVVAVGVGLMLGRLVWARSAQGMVQLRERMSLELERAKDAELEVERERERYRELREQVESGDGGTLVINSPELEEELAALRERTKEADATLEQMLLANQALESVVKDLEVQNAELVGGGTTGAEHDAAELAGLRAEIEVLRGEATDLRVERDGFSVKLEKLQQDLETAKAEGEGREAAEGKEAELTERIAALEMQLLDARRERKQVEDASAVLRKELYGLRHTLEELEKRHSLEKELDDALQDAEQRLARLQAEVATGAVSRSDLRRPDRQRPEARGTGAGNQDSGEEVVRLEVVEEGDPGEESASGPEAGKSEAGEPSPETEDVDNEDDLTRIKGIGAVLAKRLNGAGVTSFRQIALWTVEEGQEMSKELSLQNRVESGDWRGQARALHREVHGEEL